MINSDAYKILGLTGGETADQIKAAYRKQAMAFHPDRNPAGLHMMQAVNEAWELLQDVANHMASVKDYATTFAEDIMSALNAAVILDGVNVEVCGTWVWLSGNTKEHKEAIKAANFRWSGPKAMWYFRAEENRSNFNRKSHGMDDIRAKYGSESVRMAARKQIAA